MTRIVHAIRSDGFAGVERFVAALATVQADNDDSVVVIGGNTDQMVRALASRAEHCGAATVFGTVRGLRRQARQADIVNVHMTAAEVAATVALSSRRPDRRPRVVATRHFARGRGAGSGPARNVVAWAGGQRIDAEIAVSRWVAEHVAGPVHVVYPGVATRAVPAHEERERVVLVVQRLEPEKRTDAALEAFAGSGLIRHGWRLVIAGDGIQRRHLAQLSRRLSIDAATEWLGHRSDVIAVMDRAAIMLAPTPHEGLGLAVLEAMAGGLPVIAAGSGGHVETVGAAPGGRLFRTTDEAVDLLRELAGDAGQREEYGQALHATQQRIFTMQRQYADTDAVYRSLL